jgi:glyoxylase-like metal-dependent hydrolase (beta-lactamase superfamily II)
VADEALPELDRICSGEVRIAITVPYHVRSAEQLAERYDARIYGHENCRRRLRRDDRFTAVGPGFTEPGGARFHGIGRPRRNELPVEVPAHRALVTGDVVALPGGELRVWETPPHDERRQRFYDEKFLPTLVELADATRPRHLLVTHGEPLLDDAEAQLRAAFGRPPWTRQSG